MDDFYDLEHLARDIVNDVEHIFPDTPERLTEAKAHLLLGFMLGYKSRAKAIITKMDKDRAKNP